MLRSGAFFIRDFENEAVISELADVFDQRDRAVELIAAVTQIAEGLQQEIEAMFPIPPKRTQPKEEVEKQFGLPKGTLDETPPRTTDP